MHTYIHTYIHTHTYSISRLVTADTAMGSTNTYINTQTYAYIHTYTHTYSISRLVTAETAMGSINTYIRNAERFIESVCPNQRASGRIKANYFIGGPVAAMRFIATCVVKDNSHEDVPDVKTVRE
jgi:hypothetical protein